MTKHTPGPWKAGTGDYGITICSSSTESYNDVAKTTGNPGPGPEGTERANAHLIAAAPELLAALEEILPFVESYLPITLEFGELDRARTAIKKAQVTS